MCVISLLFIIFTSEIFPEKSSLNFKHTHTEKAKREVVKYIYVIFMTFLFLCYYYFTELINIQLLLTLSTNREENEKKIRQ